MGIAQPWLLLGEVKRVTREMDSRQETFHSNTGWNILAKKWEAVECISYRSGGDEDGTTGRHRMHYSVC